ncbi:sensor histidine kinase [Fimbriiglobus ruber]|nr:ATP-binding protein [Fimbriiglobus ruber]
MALRSYPGRLLFVTVLSSLLVLGLCGTVAFYLNRAQSETAGVLNENIGSRRAAGALEEHLAALIAGHNREASDVETFQEEVEKTIDEINTYADKPRERDLVRAINDSYRTYKLLWGASPRGTTRNQAAVDQLQFSTLLAAKRLRNYNAEQIDESEKEHQEALRRMAWGLGAVGGLASLGGLVFGYGLARSLRRTIHQFLVNVQGASDILDQEVPAIEWDGTDPRDDGAEALVRRVEQVVGKLQQKEREVRRAERLAAVGQLAAGVAHEVRNPLTSVILLIETSRKDPAAGGLTGEDLDLIEQELHRIESSLQIFLDYARPPSLERKPCDLTAVVRDALALVRGRLDLNRVRVVFDAPPGPVVLDADREQLRQVVLNLALNALDVMPAGGTLTVAVRPPAEAVEGESPAAEIEVRDTGTGISPEILPRLFEPFATGKETGLGLGLVVSRRIVEDHGGTLRGFNPPEGGACFVMRLPAGTVPA